MFQKIPETIGERTDYVRQQRGMKQEDLADATGMSAQTISAIINGRKNIRTQSAIALAQALNVSTDYLLMGKPATRDVDFLSHVVAQLDQRQYRCLHDIIVRFCQAIGVNDVDGTDENPPEAKQGDS